MKRFLGIAAMTVCLLAVVSCEDSTAPAQQGTIVVRTNIIGPTVTAAMPDGSTQSPDEVDSVRVQRIRVLISRIKLHATAEDTSDQAGRDVKAGPAIVTWTRDTLTTVFAAPVPTGRYDRVKLEMHKFSAAEAATYRNDSAFADFATASDRVTLIIDGVTWKDSVMTPFTLASDRTENLWVVLEPCFEITASSTTTVVLDFDAVELFRIGGRVINPSNAQVKTLLQTRLRTLLRLRKHA